MKKRMQMFILIPFLLFYAVPVSAVEKEDQKWQDESIYFLMIDRFNNGDFNNDYNVDVKDPNSYHGGDFQGVISKLDYIKDMGFTTIWLSPIFDNKDFGYDGFWIQDYYNTEEHFGSIDEFKLLVDEAHKRDMKVMIEFVTNLENSDGSDYLMDVAKWWIKETNIDGYYLNNIHDVSSNFLIKFVEEIKGIKEDFFLLGDVKPSETKQISQYEETGIDGFINYPLMELVRPIFSQVDMPMNDLLKEEEKLNSVYQNPYVMGNLLDNNQTDRFTRDAITKNQHPGPRWKLALTHLYTMPGIPIVSYGSEIALDGEQGIDNYRQMDFRTDKELIDYITKIGELRNTLPALTRGTFEILAEEKGMIVYKRTYQDETIVIAINNSSESLTVTLSADSLEDEKELRGLLAGDLVRSSDGQYTLYMDREKAEIYALAPKTGLNIPFLAAMGIGYAVFILFIFLLWKRSKRKAS